MVRIDGLVRGAWTSEACRLLLFFRPREDCGHDLKDLEAFGVAAIEGEELEEVVCYQLSRQGC